MVMLLDSSFAVEDSLSFSTGPWDITPVDDDTAIVAFPGAYKLQYIHISPKLSHGRTISVDGRCYSITMVDCELYVSCCDKHGKGYIRVSDEHGKEKRRIVTDRDGSRIFQIPHYIIANMSGTKLYVSDWSTSMVSCLTTDGQLIYQCKLGNMGNVHGLYVDAEDNLLVCNYNGKSVQVITAEGKIYKTLLSKADGLFEPRCIDFRPRDSHLVVGCRETNKLLIFKLE